MRTQGRKAQPDLLGAGPVGKALACHGGRAVHVHAGAHSRPVHAGVDVTSLPRGTKEDTPLQTVHQIMPPMKSSPQYATHLACPQGVATAEPVLEVPGPAVAMTADRLRAAVTSVPSVTLARLDASVGCDHHTVDTLRATGDKVCGMRVKMQSPIRGMVPLQRPQRVRLSLTCTGSGMGMSHLAPLNPGLHTHLGGTELMNVPHTQDCCTLQVGPLHPGAQAQMIGPVWPVPCTNKQVRQSHREASGTGSRCVEGGSARTDGVVSTHDDAMGPTHGDVAAVPGPPHRVPTVALGLVAGLARATPRAVLRTTAEGRTKCVEVSNSCASQTGLLHGRHKHAPVHSSPCR